MAIACEFKRILVDSVVISDKWSLTPFQVSTSSTSESHSTILATGILHPPIVKKVDNKEKDYELLCGNTRFSSFRNSFPDENHITVLVLYPDVSHEEILQCLLDDKLVSGKFSCMEKAIFLQYCCKYLSLKAVAKIFLPPLDEKPQPYVINKLISLTTLENPLQQSIHSGQLSQKLGIELLTLSANDRMKLHNLFLQLELGGGKQKRLFTLCKDLAFRQNKKITSLLAEDEYIAILDHSEMNEPQKGTSLLNLLHKQLFPESSNAENDFRKRVNHMELPTNCSVEHSPAFERDEISLTVKFKDMGQLEKQTRRIKEMLS